MIALLLALVCGIERWDVKTLSDPAAVHVSCEAKHTTIAALNRLPDMCETTPDARLPGVESNLYEIVGRVEFAAREADRDYHLAIADLERRRTIIVEIVDPDCAPKSKRLQTLRATRKQFEAMLGGKPLSHIVGQTVRVRGVGFYDRPHGQHGMARNCLELHPVLSVSFCSSQDPRGIN